MTGTCDTEGRISVIMGAQDTAGMAAGENERNGAKEADAAGCSMALHSLCARRRGLRHHRRRRRCRRRVATQGDLWRNATRPFSSTSSFLSRQFAASLSVSRLTNFTSACYLRPSTPQRSCDLSRRPCVKRRSRRTLFARRPKRRPVPLRRWNFETMRILWEEQFSRRVLTLIQLVLLQKWN